MWVWSGRGTAHQNAPRGDLLTFMMMFRDSSLGRKMHTLRRSCMTLLLWKVSLFIVLWALQWAGWAHRVLSSCSKASFSSSSYGQQEKHRGAPLCRFHSWRQSTGRPVRKGGSLVSGEAGREQTAVPGTRDGTDTLCPLTPIPTLRSQTSVNRHSESLDSHRRPSTTDSRRWIPTEEFPVSQGR